MPGYHRSSASSGSSYNSACSNESGRTCDTAITTYSTQSFDRKRTKMETNVVSPRASVETYASTVDFGDDEERKPSGPYPARRYQCYEPDSIPASTGEFAAVFPSTRRLLIQHDETTEDGNMNLHVDTEVTTTSGRKKKLTLFHLRMKDLQERHFSLRRYCRDSGREVASSKKHYIKSAPSTSESSRRSSQKSLSNLSEKSSIKTRSRADSGYGSDTASDDEDEDERQMLERLNLMTTPADQVVSTPTTSIRLEFSNYAQIILEKAKEENKKGYAFEYWGDSYFWKREKQFDSGEIIYCYDLVRESDGRKMAIIMPDALSPQEAKWEAKQGGWIPASSMRLLDGQVSDDLGDVIMTTGLIALTDGSMRQHFKGIDRRR